MRGKLISRGIAMVTIITGLCFANSASAVPVEFNLRDTTATSEIISGVLSRGGIVATLSPLVSGSSGMLNLTSGAFGINAAGTGDNTDELDSALGAEAIAVTFDVDVLWTALSVSSFGSGESGQVTIGANSPVAIATTGLHTFTTDNAVPAGSLILIAHVTGSGFSLDSFTVEPWTLSDTTDSNSVPDGGPIIGLLGISLAALGLFSHRS